MYKLPGVSKRYQNKQTMLPLQSINREFHYIIDTIESLLKEDLSKSYFISSLYDIKEIIENIEYRHDSMPELLADKPRVCEQVESILKWLVVSLDKLIVMISKENYTSEELHNLLKFIYESTWKLIIIFEEVLSVPCKRCKSQGRMVIYRNLFNKNPNQKQSFNLREESRCLEQDIVNQLKQMDRS